MWFNWSRHTRAGQSNWTPPGRHSYARAVVQADMVIEAGALTRVHRVVATLDLTGPAEPVIPVTWVTLANSL